MTHFPHFILEYNKTINAQRHTYVILAHERLGPAWPTEQECASKRIKLKFYAKYF